MKNSRVLFQMSYKLQDFFSAYDFYEIEPFLTEVFGCIYVKSRNSPDLGVCCWYGIKPKNWDSPIDRDWTEIQVEVNSKKGGPSLAIFTNYTEDQVIEKFTRYQNLKAFL